MKQQQSPGSHSNLDAGHEGKSGMLTGASTGPLSPPESSVILLSGSCRLFPESWTKHKLSVPVKASPRSGQLSDLSNCKAVFKIADVSVFGDFISFHLWIRVNPGYDSKLFSELLTLPLQNHLVRVEFSSCM